MILNPYTGFYLNKDFYQAFLMLNILEMCRKVKTLKRS